MIFLLDTSALLAHHRDEVGSDRVQSLFDDQDCKILISSISLTEFGRRMVALGSSAKEVELTLDDYRLLFVSGHFKMHHLWSLQSAPLLTGGFLGFLGLVWQGVFLFP